MIPLPKEGDLTKCTNYRPMSLLPLPGKLIEKIVHNRVSNFLENHTLLDPNQGVYRVASQLWIPKEPWILNLNTQKRPETGIFSIFRIFRMFF